MINCSITYVAYLEDVVAASTSHSREAAEANGEETRRRILLAAIRCVAERGYSRASIREIARTADMSPGSLYHYFPNKAELLKAAVDEIEALAFPRLRGAAALPGDVVGRLEAVLDESDRLMRDFPYLAAFERAIRAEGAAYLRAGEAVGIELGPLRDIIATIIEDALRDGTFAPGTDTRGVIDALYALTRGLTEQAALTPRAHHDTVVAAKEMLRGSLFASGWASSARRGR